MPPPDKYLAQPPYDALDAAVFDYGNGFVIDNADVHEMVVKK
jgi:hypothetical protein